MDYKSFYQEQTANLRYKEDVELVPVAELWKLRDFDRRTEPKADQAESDDTIDKLKDVLLHGELREALVIDYFPYERRAYLSEGNHRLAAARENGMQYLPVTVQRCSRKAPPKAKPVPGADADQYGYVRADILPSQIGIPGCINEAGQLVEVPFHNRRPEPKPQRLSVSHVRTKITDAEFWSRHATLAYEYVDMNKAFELVDYAGAQKMFEQMRRPELITATETVVYRFSDVIWRYMEIEQVFSAKYHRYLEGVLNMPGASARDLYEELSDKEYDARTRPVLYALTKAAKIAQQKCRVKHFQKTFFGTGLESLHGRPVYFDYFDQGYDSYITLEVETEAVQKFKTIRADDTSLHEIIKRELAEQGSLLHYDDNSFGAEHIDYAIVHAELDKTIS